MTEELKKKVDFAISLIKSASKIANDNGSKLEVCYSGGKDSDVILELTRMAGVPYEAIYKNTTIDPKGTIKHALEQGATMIRPKVTFAELIRKKGFPNMFSRFCCEHLKEYKVYDYAILGVRREESRKRAERYKEPEECRVFRGGDKTRQYYPILEWAKEDISDFIAARGIKCHPLYYDEEGIFHAERRLGCIACPLISKKQRLKVFTEHPNLVKLYCRNGQIYLKEHPNCKALKHHKDAYEMFVGSLFYDNIEDYINSKNSMFGEMDYKSFLEDYFKIKF